MHASRGDPEQAPALEPRTAHSDHHASQRILAESRKSKSRSVCSARAVAASNARAKRGRAHRSPCAPQRRSIETALVHLRPSRQSMRTYPVPSYTALLAHLRALKARGRARYLNDTKTGSLGTGQGARQGKVGTPGDGRACRQPWNVQLSHRERLREQRRRRQEDEVPPIVSRRYFTLKSLNLVRGWRIPGPARWARTWAPRSSSS